MPEIPAHREPPHVGSRYLSQIVGERIGEIRRSRKVSQGLIADRMQELGHGSWERQTVGLVESARRNLTVDELVSLAAALQTTLAFLLSPLSAWGNPQHMVDVGGPEGLDTKQLRDLYGFLSVPFPNTNGYYDWPETVWKEAEERMPPIGNNFPPPSVFEEDER